MFTKQLLFLLLILIIAIYSLPTVRSDDSNLCSNTPVSLCPISCFRPDPVCGIDGVTYWCGCADAHCAGTRVSKLGACEGNDSSVSGQALLLINILWLTLLAFFVLFGLLWMHTFGFILFRKACSENFEFTAWGFIVFIDLYYSFCMYCSIIIGVECVKFVFPRNIVQLILFLLYCVI